VLSEIHRNKLKLPGDNYTISCCIRLLDWTSLSEQLEKGEFSGYRYLTRGRSSGMAPGRGQSSEAWTTEDLLVLDFLEDNTLRTVSEILSIGLYNWANVELDRTGGN
jgi:hypothetical protein